MIFLDPIMIACLIGFIICVRITGQDMIRFVMAAFRIAYLPKIGVNYYYSMSGPFGDVLTPTKIINGYVEYDVMYADGNKAKSSATFSTWAFMCKEIKK